MIISSSNTSAYFLPNKPQKNQKNFIAQLSEEINKGKESRRAASPEKTEKETSENSETSHSANLIHSKSYTEEAKTYKQKLSHFNAFAITQYETFNNLEIQKAKVELLGFSAYA